jgi:hypothetical protein
VRSHVADRERIDVHHGQGWPCGRR